MGITGLIPFLEKSSRPINISEFSGATVVVDAYCWLHKGAFSCAEKLARGEKCDAYVHYCMKFINMLLSHNIKPILVFDGRHLPAKAITEKKRRESREINRRRAAELLRQDKPDEAKVHIRRCVDITHAMALELMQKCRSYNVDCITAPYEADSQLAYLNIMGIAHLVITEDSDLLLFGCKKVLFKMDLYGNGLLIEQENLPLAMKMRSDNYDFDKFRRMCILSGCDYLPSLPGIGLSKACKFMSKTADSNIHRALTRMASYLNMPSLNVTKEYRDSVVHAEAMFKHQPVFDPISRKVVPMTPLEDDTPPLQLPPPLPDDQAYQLALGNLEPFSLEVVCDWDPDNNKITKSTSWGNTWCNHPSIWTKNFETVPMPTPKPVKKIQIAPSSKNKRPISKTESIPVEKTQYIDDADLEATLKDFDADDELMNSPAAKKICLDKKNTNTPEIPNIRPPSPSLSSENNPNQKLSDIFKNNSVSDNKSSVFSRYFFNSNSSTSESTKTLIDSPTNKSCESKENNKDKLKDLSNFMLDNKIDSHDFVKLKISPRKNFTKEDSENLTYDSTKIDSDSGIESVNNIESFSESFSSQNSFTSEPSSQTSNRSSSSLFKWKKQFGERFGYNKSKLSPTKSADSHKLTLNDSNVSFNNESTELRSLSDENEKMNNLNKEICVTIEKKKCSNPFKMNSSLTKPSASLFSLLRDPVPDVFTKEIDESFTMTSPTPDQKKTSPKCEPPPKKPSSSSSKSKIRSVGLSKKATLSKPAQKSLLSMFMLQPKPKMQC